MGRLEALTLEALKQYCRDNRLSLTGNKAELLARIKTHLGVLAAPGPPAAHAGAPSDPGSAAASVLNDPATASPASAPSAPPDAGPSYGEGGSGPASLPSSPARGASVQQGGAAEHHAQAT